jgi:precorrin-6B methylase 2
MISDVIRRAIPERFRPIGYLVHLTRQRTACIVQKGPFEGLRIVTDAAGSALIPKLLGIYERELHPAIEEIMSMNPALVVDIGAAEGFYAVGLARRLPGSRVIAFEMESPAREKLRQNAEANDVSAHLSIRGCCDAESLSAALAEGSPMVVICDAEGAENEVLDPEAVPALKTASILVELHDFIRPGTTERLIERFSSTHSITTIEQTPRHRDEFPWKTRGTRLLPKAYLDWAVSEWRPVPMSWLWIKATQ